MKNKTLNRLYLLPKLAALVGLLIALGSFGV